MFLWAEFRDPRFYPSSCESLPSIATIGGLTEAARLGTSQAELKDGDKVDEECAAADPPEISDAQNNRKRCRE
ncbi:hypothetical protein F2Q69_00009639 [Brassica cretica]|uniref:Uncharacterized protein n=1 Tax=Brassica cretica TaxID=69181 RepID=A0A8S9NTV2_BRACR|nr:hypothetical protein F2Q69_00009639 [Brassica cretica]